MTINVVTPEMQSKIAEWRRKAADGSITLPEMKEAIIALRAGRTAAAAAAAASGKSSRKKTPARSADDLLSELGGLPG